MNAWKWFVLCAARRGLHYFFFSSGAFFCCYFVRKCADFVNFSAVFVVNVLHSECESYCNAAVFFTCARVRASHFVDVNKMVEGVSFSRVRACVFVISGIALRASPVFFTRACVRGAKVLK